MAILKKEATRSKKSVFGLFILISLALHLLIGLILNHQYVKPEHLNKIEPTKVSLQERNNWLELDQKPIEEPSKPPKEATHIAEINAEVEKEAAPKGDDSRDKERVEQQKQQLAQQKATRPQPPTVQKRVPTPSPPLQADNLGDQSPAINPQPNKKLDPLQIKLPELRELTNLSPQTLARLDRQQQKQRIKDRPEIELKEDEVWLNLRQDDKLISFFRRFSDRIEAVWNYPVEASMRGIEGTLLIKIIVNKKGELIDAFPLESSGSEILDYEAITAVYRAAPFGDLPSYYKHDQLKIFAHFQYSLSRRMLYGNPYN